MNSRIVSWAIAICLLALVRVIAQSEAPTKAPAAPQNPAASEAAAAPSAADEKGWQDLFDGRSLEGWKITEFGGAGGVEVKDGAIILPMGAELTGVNYEGAVPEMDYEVRLEAMNVLGSDFFCALTFPVAKAHCTLIVGGWGGGVVGISSLDGMDASENDTTRFMKFENKRWYRIRLRVTEPKIEAWIDDAKVVDAPIKDRKISMRAGSIEMSKPFGLASYQTTAALRKIQLRKVASE